MEHFNLYVKDLAIKYYLKSFQMDLDHRLSPLSSSDKENEDAASHYRAFRCPYHPPVDRQKLERELSEKNLKPPQDEDYRDPSDFEPSATDWVPSDENPSDSEIEVENKKRKLSIPKTTRKRQRRPKNVLAPRNKENTTVRRRNSRKQPSPKQFISPNKEEPIFIVPLPKKIISPTGKTIHILPNSTRPIPLNNTKQVALDKKRGSTKGRNNKKQFSSRGKKQLPPNVKKQVSPYARNYNPRKRTYQATKTVTPQNNLTKDIDSIAKKVKSEINENKNNVEGNILKERPADNNSISNTKNKDSVSKTEKKLNVTAENKNVINEQVKDISKNTLNIDNRKNDQAKTKSKFINFKLDFEKYSKFRKSVRKVYKMYDTALKVIPENKRKEMGLKGIKRFYKAKSVVAYKEKPNQQVAVNDTNSDLAKKVTPKTKRMELGLKGLKRFHKSKMVVGYKETPNQQVAANETNSAGAEGYSDENMENETLDDFDRSDDNILISNKFHNINTEKKSIPKNDKLVAIGSGKTLIPKDKFRKIKWTSYTVATRGLMLAAFPRRVLATHSLTGKRSPAFLNKPAKMCLDPKKVSDIIIEVVDRFKIRENLVRSVITTKCADESKMFKTRMQKKERETTAKEQNTKEKNNVIA